MKKLNYLPVLICAFLLPQLLKAQNIFKANLVNQKAAINTSTLDSEIRDYKLYDFDPKPFANHIRNAGEEFTTFRLILGEEYNWDVSLTAHDLRSPDIKITVSTAEGIITLPKGENITYEGFLNDEVSTKVRMTIKENYVAGYVLPEDGRGVYFHSTTNIKGINDAKTLLVYKVGDALKEFNCKFDQLGMEIKEMPERKQKNPKAPVCQVTEIALICDKSFVDEMGGGTAQGAIDIMTQYLNAVDLLYDTHGIDFVVSEFFVSDNQTTEPWSNATTDGDEDDIVSEVISWADNGGLGNGRDIITFWTSRGLGHAEAKWIVCSPPFTWVPDDGWGGGNACDPWGGLGNAAWNISIQAHELGHNFGMYTHVSGNYIMNPAPPHDASGHVWKQETIDRIADTLASDFVNCLESCGPAVPIVNFSGTPQGVCPGQSVQFTDATNNNPTTWEWSFPGSNLTSYTGQNPPAITYSTAGSYSVTLTATNAEGSATLTLDDYIVVNNSQSLPIQEGFEGTFPPTGWSINNPDGGLEWQQRTDAGNNSSSSMIMNNADNANTGEIDEIITPPYNLSSVLNPQFTFDVAYTKFDDNSPDVLRIFASEDCGVNWTEVWIKTHTDLETVVVASNQSNDWVPSQSSDWREETVDISSYANKPSVSFKFHNTSGYGTRVWVDNLNITNQLGINAVESNKKINIYPNPNNGTFKLKFVPSSEAEYTIEVTNVLGQTVYDDGMMLSGVYEKQIQLPEEKGIYILTIKSGSYQINKRIVRN